MATNQTVSVQVASGMFCKSTNVFEYHGMGGFTENIHITEFDDFNNSAFERARRICREFNATGSNAAKQVLQKQMFTSVGERLVIIQPITIDTGNVKIGHNCFINSGCKFIDFGGITIGNNVGLSVGVTLITNNHPCNPLTLDKWVDVKEPIVIEDDVWIGANAIVVGNVTIGKGAMIGAGSIVTRDIPPGEVWAGNPARYIETVDEYKKKFAEKHRLE